MLHFAPFMSGPSLFFFLLDFRILGVDLNGNECSEKMWPHSKNVKLAENQPTV